MAVRCYKLYTAGAAGASIQNLRIVRNGEIQCVHFEMSGAASQGLRVELSTNPASQATTNDAQGTIASCGYNAGTDLRTVNATIPIPGLSVQVGDTLYLHGTQLGSGATVPTNVYVYIREK